MCENYYSSIGNKLPKTQTAPENIDASPTYGFVGNFHLPQNPTGNSIFGSYLPVPSKVLAFETLPPPPPNFQLPTLEWEWIFAVPIYTLILDVSTTVCDTQ